MRSFEFARKIENGKVVSDKAYDSAQLPEYQTKYSAGADFFAAEDTIIRSIWGKLLQNVTQDLGLKKYKADSNVINDVYEVERAKKMFAPTLIHTGVKASMEEDEVLYLYNRSSNPKKMGLILANGVGVVDSDYFNNPDNDGEIMFAFYNILPWDVKITAGTRIGQGVFAKYLRPTVGLKVKDADRQGGLGSTGK